MKRLLVVAALLTGPALVIAQNPAQDPNALGPGDPAWRGQTVQMNPAPAGADVGGLDPATIMKPLSDQWTSYSGDLSGKRYSQLKQVNTATVKKARNGVLEHTRRQSYLASLLGVRRAVLAVNKLDLAGYSREVFERIRDEYLAYAGKLELAQATCVPLSALHGDNVASPGTHMPWYQGPSLADHLEAMAVEEDLHAAPLRFLVQWVNRPDSGCIAGRSF